MLPYCHRISQMNGFFKTGRVGVNVVTLMQVRAEWVLGDWSTCSDMACITPGREAERSVFLACLECQMTSLRLFDIGQMDAEEQIGWFGLGVGA